MTTSARIRGPLSVQQEAVLRNPQGQDSIVRIFDLAASVSGSELYRRVARMTGREQVMRTVSFGRDGACYQDEIALPIRHVMCAGQSDEDRVLRETRDVVWKPGQPMWSLTVCTRTDVAPGTPQRASLVIDHMIGDVLTLALMVREITTGEEPAAVRGRGRYPEWVREQRRRFDPQVPGARADARRFWTQVLGGASPERATSLPGVRDAVAAEGTGTVALSVPVTVSASTVQLAARKARATPLVLALASIAATLADEAGDVSLAVVTHGRPVGYAATYGWLANQIPMRIRHENLRDFGAAVTAARQAWERVLGRLHEPWEFLVAACADATEIAWAEPAGRRQLLVNYFPEPAAGITDAHYRDQHPEYPQGMGWLELQIIPLAEGGHMFRILCNSNDLDLESVRGLLRRLCDDFAGNVSAAVQEIPR